MKQISASIAATAEVMGAELTPAGLKIFTRDLALLLTNDQIKQGLERTRREVRQLTLQDVLARAGEVTTGEAESLLAVAAWDEAERLVKRYGRYGSDDEVTLRRIVGPAPKDCPTCKGEGHFIREEKGVRFVGICNCRPIEEVPEVSQRLADTVRRIGGWTVLKEVPPSKFPFLRRDFLTEYTRWQKVESIPGSQGGELVVAGSIAGGNAEDFLEQMLRKS
jgi:hypothetical protein